MDRLTFPDFDLHLSALGFGCDSLMRLPSRRARTALLNSALESGLTHFDIARMYGLGAAERELGAFLRTIDRDSVTIATKFGIYAAGPAARFGRIQGPARAVMRRMPTVREAVKRRGDAFASGRRYRPVDAARSLDESLRSLGVNHVDILFLHAPRPEDHLDVDGLNEFFDRARCAGKIRAWGVSQDEGLEVDLAQQFGSAAIRQLRCSELKPPHRPADIAFGILRRPLTDVTSALRSDTKLLDRWMDTLQTDPLAPGALARILIQYSRSVVGCGAVLYNTTRPERLAEAARAFSSPVDTTVLELFRGLVEQPREDE